MKLTAFISGHIDLTKEEFEEHYALRIREAAGKGHHFVVGDAPGCDFMAQRFVHDNTPRLTVYHMLQSPRHCVGTGYGSHDEATRARARPNPNVRLVGGFESDEERDAAMTAASDYDIAWVRSGRHKSGTAKNLRRRDARLLAEKLALRATWPKAHVDTLTDDGEPALRFPGGADMPRIPVPPDFEARHRATWEAYRKVQDEIYRLIEEARILGDIERPE